jgi:3-hydroxyacyl-CoA dehydrogenase
MSDVVNYELRDNVAVITIDNPPVNALSQAVRQGIQDGVRRAAEDQDAVAAVIIGGGRTFIAGADIREFGKPMQEPDLNSVIADIEKCSKPVVAALHGTALGGGLEVALGAHYRCIVPSGRVGLPEVHLGLLPGAGGTQRLPRIAGVEMALDMIVSGRHVKAQEALEHGIVDRIVEGDLLEDAIGYAKELANAGASLRKIRDLPAQADAKVFDDFEKSIARRQRGFLAPFHCIKAVRAAVESKTFEEGMQRERELFAELMASDESKAQRYVFFGEREVAKIPDVPKDTRPVDIKNAAVVGAGTMGGGIAMCFANAGIPVKLLEIEEDALKRGVEIIRKNYANTVAKGRLSEEDMQKRLSLIQPTMDYKDIADADIVIEAVFEEMGVKKEVFGTLDEVMKQGAVLATNTSTLDIDEIASATKRPEWVIGTHFFSPANVMRLLENVRGKASSAETIATVMTMGRRIGKIAVLAGNCDGFIGNRMLHKYRQQADFMLEEGAMPWDIDRVIYDFGLPMGPFQMGDLAGNDVSWRIRKGKAHLRPNDMRYCAIPDKLCEMGRFGQKTQAGWYDYDENRKATPSKVVEELILNESKERGIERREISDQEILERCIYPMINEGARILEEGIAIRPVDIDIVWINGYGFPAYRGGPMFYGSLIGLDKVHEAILKYREQHGSYFFEPAPLLEKLAKEGKTFLDM